MAFYEGHFGRTADWDRARRIARPVSSALADALERQNARHAGSPRRDAHLAALRAGAAAVVTGQQCGLFLGPLFTIAKAASAIRLAQHLAERWASPVVPVFWLQTEDHDAAEIAVCHVVRSGNASLTLELPVEAAHVSVAHRVLPDAVRDELGKLADALAHRPHGGEHLDLLSRHYRPGAGWGEAFAGTLAELFAHEGLVLLDPRDPALAGLAAPVHRRALVEARPIASALAARVLSLKSQGFAEGVHLRADAPLSFYHPDGPTGPRRRVAAEEVSDLLPVLETDPARFSTSALLRPILQDTWLPTAAYVGGPGEVAYFAQLAPLYAAFQVTMPIVVPRLRLRLIEEPTRRMLARRALTPEAACRPLEAALAAARGGEGGGPSGEEIGARVKAGIGRVLTEITPMIAEGGDHARHAMEKARRGMNRSAERLGRGFDRARLLADREIVDDVLNLQARLMPRGVPQERYFGLPSFAARYGQRAFLEAVLAAAEPLRTGIADLAL